MSRLILSLLLSTSVFAAPCSTVTFDFPPAWPASSNSVFADFNGDGLTDVATNVQSSIRILLADRNLGYELIGVTDPLNSPTLNSGDFDGDGRPDLVISSIVGGTRKLSVLRGDGRGGFTTTFTADATPPPFVGDFDGDGRSDLLDPKGTIFHGNADGTLTTTTFAPTDFSILGLVADFDGDGKSDFVYLSPSNGIVIATGASGMSSRIVVAGYYSLTALKVGDANGDGRPDVFFTVYDDGMKVALNHGGTFNGWVQAHVPMSRFFAVGDLDGDGMDDTVTTATGEAIYYHSNGDGTYSPARRFVAGNFGGNFGVTGVADFNGDGLADVAIPGDAGLTIIPNRGNGTLGGVTMLNTMPYGNDRVRIMAAVDINHDGRVDLITTESPAQIVAWLNLPAGFAAVHSYLTQLGDPTAALSEPVSFAYGDINGDGNVDILTTRRGNDTANSGQLIRYLGDGTGQFVATTDTYAVGTNPAGVFLTDIDGDGRNEIVVFNKFASSTLNVVRVGPDGALQPPIDAVPSVRGYESVTAGDFNGDGALDFIGYSPYAPPGIVLSDGHGGYLPPQPSSLYGGMAADLNGDGKADVIDSSIHYSNGDGRFGNGPAVPSQAIAVADMNGDGLPDVISRNSNAFIVMYLNRGDSFDAVTLPVKTATLAAADLDLDGRTDLVIGGTGTILRNVCTSANAGPRRRAAKP